MITFYCRIVRRVENRPKLSNATRFNDLEWPLTQISRSRYYSTSNNSTIICAYTFFNSPNLCHRTNLLNQKVQIVTWHSANCCYGRTDGRTDRWRDKIALASTALTASDCKIVNKTKTNIIIIIINNNNNNHHHQCHDIIERQIAQITFNTWVATTSRLDSSPSLPRSTLESRVACTRESTWNAISYIYRFSLMNDVTP